MGEGVWISALADGVPLIYLLPTLTRNRQKIGHEA